MDRAVWRVIVHEVKESDATGVSKHTDKSAFVRAVGFNTIYHRTWAESHPFMCLR